MYPQLTIDLNKIKANADTLSRLCAQHHIKIMAVTKSFCGDLRIVQALSETSIDYLADSRIQNLAKYEMFNLPKVLLRLPMLSEIKEVIRYADYSLNSEPTVLEALSREAQAADKQHGLILMFDLGDLREGILPQEMDDYLGLILNLPHLYLAGIGVNLTCYGGIIPDEKNLGQLAQLARTIESKYGLSLEIISGGNSSSLYLLEDESGCPKPINNLRLGESLVLGRETAFASPLPNLHTDAFKLECELIELKTKGSKPTGQIGRDAFGNVPHFQDRGMIKRGILAIGRQDVDPAHLKPLDTSIQILGASSDHLILDLSQCREAYRVGDIIDFELNYASLLSLFTSPYVSRVYL